MREIPWLFEPLTEDRGFELKRLFSMDAAYLDGSLCLAFATRSRDPWSGLLVCTDRDRHAALRAEFPDLIAHQVLGKWLYLSENHPDFERLATQLVTLALDRDRRIGIAAKPTKPTKAKIGLPLGLVPWTEKKPPKQARKKR